MIKQKTTRGFACIGLDNAKDLKNIGSALRAAYCYNAAMIAVSGRRYERSCTDTPKSYKSLPLLQVNDLKEIIPYSCVPVAVDLIEGASPLPGYTHPESAFYIFGAEDQTLGEKILSYCRDVVYIPTKICMNLAATVNVVLYDRLSKS